MDDRHDADIAAVAGLLANPARSAMLEVLLDGRSHPSGDLAREARIAPSTASGHLAALVGGGLVEAQRSGRERRYRLAGPAVAHAMESLAVIAPRRPVSSLRQATKNDHLRNGRTCYDHLAGQLGVSIADALISRRAIRLVDGSFELTGPGEAFFEKLGIDVADVRRRRRGFALACQDWTERRLHLAGALGAALCERLFDLHWVRRRPSGRAVVLSADGADGLSASLGIVQAPGRLGD